MAKNTSSSEFRKIDVDQYCEDTFKEDEVDQSGPTGPDENEVKMCLQKGKFIEALKTVLSNAPLGSKSQQTRIVYSPNKNGTQIVEIELNCYFNNITVDLHQVSVNSIKKFLLENATCLTLKVLLSIKPSQIEEAVNSLSPDLVDVLMKYVYKGFENPPEGNSGHLLLWHEKVYNVGGVGCIVRVLSDTRRA